MFVREKSARGHTYLYLVENEREGGRIRQRIIRALGRKDVLLASGELDRLAASLVRHCDRAVILSDMEAGRIHGLRNSLIDSLPSLDGVLFRKNRHRKNNIHYGCSYVYNSRAGQRPQLFSLWLGPPSWSMRGARHICEVALGGLGWLVKRAVGILARR
jgi:hypothetical protein